MCNAYVKIRAGVSDLETSMSDLDEEIAAKDVEAKKKATGKNRPRDQRGKRGGEKHKKKMPKVNVRFFGFLALSSD